MNISIRQLGENAGEPGRSGRSGRMAALKACHRASEVGDAIKAKLREDGFARVSWKLPIRQREQTNEVDDKTQTGTVVKK